MKTVIFPIAIQILLCKDTDHGNMGDKIDIVKDRGDMFYKNRSLTLFLRCKGRFAIMCPASLKEISYARINYHLQYVTQLDYLADIRHNLKFKIVTRRHAYF